MKKLVREQVFNKCGGNCGYCGKPLESDWQVDHMTPKYHYIMVPSLGNADNISNLMPACRKCNHYKREKPVETEGHFIGFRDYMKTFHIRLAKLPNKTTVRRTEERIKYMQDIAERYGIAPDKPFNGVFYFETILKEQ